MAVYLVARIDVTDPEDYNSYASRTAALIAEAGGRVLAKGGEQSYVEGSGPGRHVIIEFPDRATAEAWYSSPGYQEILPIALRSSERDIVIVEGA
ncbi:DUF1330 domain-containing protein [Pseudooceanicola sp. HF7]|uniref:DUF1330 domain-containing protein n=1 Tax=Pseudooceanicola sp. HF7 TaxID=2721560 RepID=UPI00142F5CF4|nr:DUF1330 domain-containing protein [Pseudooceanicola sp. HF7]NIZ08829.1 DUF1330 domain-containing protein [Pseudooceanicola sp. HF7]